MPAETGVQSTMPTSLEPPDEVAVHGVRVTIYQPTRSTMQSGRGKTKHWQLEFDPGMAPFIDPLMGWVGSTDPNNQVRMSFPTKDEAIAFARRQGWKFSVHQPPHRTKLVPKSYADNFFGQSSLEQS